MPRPELDRVVEVVQAAQGRIQGVRARPRIHCEIGPADLADQEGVAAEQGERLAGAVTVAQHQGEVLRAMARRRARRQDGRADGDRVAADAGCRSRTRRRAPALTWIAGARELGQAAVARDVVGVRVRLHDVHDPEAMPGRELEVLVDGDRRVDHDGFPRAGDDVRGAAEICVDQLAEEHRSVTPLERRVRAVPSPNVYQFSRDKARVD